MCCLHNTVSVIKQILSISKSWLAVLELSTGLVYTWSLCEILVNRNSLSLVNMYRYVSPTKTLIVLEALTRKKQSVAILIS